MHTKVITHATKYKEETGYGHMFHNFTEKTTPLTNTEVFSSFLGLKEIIIRPNLGLLPHLHKNQTLIIVNLSGTLAQRSILNESTIIPKDTIQLIEYKEGSHFEYNMDKSTTIHCLAFILTSKNEKNISELFTLSSDKNRLSMVFENSVTNTKKQTISFYQGVFDKNKTKTYHFGPIKSGFICYLYSGELLLEHNVVLKEKDTVALWDKNSLSFTVTQDSRFFILKISDI
ncbi:hypothetical protein [uncultured Marixanthomonas sp.]|uniref:pirin family protein n=1 Tax=uncultured Marixanthomonas sp. TaxID=757245 RepID=UPI0030D8982B|tara:strand:+ start:5253 stop:5942 length:690 start_codon:yes stop_codon:yes gene_type:complete